MFQLHLTPFDLKCASTNTKKVTKLELYQLEAFEAVALHRSFTRAAQVLFVTQPAVTRQIAALEAELKMPLFERLGRTVRLTPAGEVLHRYAEQIVRLEREAREAVRDVETSGGGRLHVGASSTLATYVLPPLLRAFRQTHERAEIAVSTGLSAHIIELVRNGEADLGLVTAEPETRHTGLRFTVVADYETCAVLPPTHPLAQKRELSPADLADGPLILMEQGTNLRTYVDRLLSTAGVVEQIAMELDNVEAIKRMVEAGLGVSLLPEVAVRAEVASGRLVALPLGNLPRTPRRIALVQRTDKHLTGAMRAFVELVRAENAA